MFFSFSKRHTTPKKIKISIIIITYDNIIAGLWSEPLNPGMRRKYLQENRRKRLKIL